MKKALTLTMLILVLLLTGCINNASEGKKPSSSGTPESRVLFSTDAPADSDGIISLTIVDALSEPVELDYERNITTYTADEVMSMTRAVLRGKVTAVEEVEVKYLASQSSEIENNDEKLTTYITRLTVSVDEVYFLSQKGDAAAGDSVNIWYSNTTRAYSDDLPLLKAGDDIFTFVTTMTSKFNDYGKYVTFNPENLLFVQTDGKYDFSRILNVFGTDMWGINEGEAPVLGMMHEFFNT